MLLWVQGPYFENTGLVVSYRWHSGRRPPRFQCADTRTGKSAHDRRETMTEAPLSCVRLPLAHYKEGGRRHLTHNGHSSIDVDPTQNGPLPHTLDAAPSSHRDGGRETSVEGAAKVASL